MIKNRMLNAGEFIEYAIVDELNKEKFEAGQNYTPARPGWAKRNAVVDHGNSAFMEGTALFLCLCNENKMSPVDVFFKYEIYDLEEVQQ